MSQQYTANFEMQTHQKLMRNAKIVTQQRRIATGFQHPKQQRKTMDAKLTTTLTKFPPSSNQNENNNHSKSSSPNSNPTKIIITRESGHGQQNSNSTSSSSATSTSMSTTNNNRIWWRYFTPINELWLLRIRCNNCAWECSMRRGELKFQQLQWHLIGTHPQLWRQKCRDEAAAAANSAQITANLDGKNENEQQGKDGDGNDKNEEKQLENVDEGKADEDKIGNNYILQQEVKPQTPEKVNATEVPTNAIDDKSTGMEKTNAEQTPIKTEPPYDDDQWEMEEMQIIPENGADEAAEEMADDPPENEAYHDQLDESTTSAAAVSINQSARKLAVIIPSTVKQSFSPSTSVIPKRGLPFQLSMLPSTSIEIGVGPQKFNSADGNDRYDYPEEYSYCILCGKKLADFYVMRLHLRRQHNYLITLDALREKVARFWSDPRANANLLGKQYGGGRQQGKTEFSKKYSQCIICKKVFCDFYYLYNHVWTQHGYRKGRETFRDEIIKYWKLDEINDNRGDKSGHGQRQIHSFQLFERNVDDVEEEYEEKDGKEDEMMMEEDEAENCNDEMPELFTEESPVIDPEEEELEEKSKESAVEDGMEPSEFDTSENGQIKHQKPSLENEEAADVKDEDDDPDLPPKLPMMAKKKSTPFASKNEEERFRQKLLLERMKAKKIFTIDKSSGSTPTNLDNLMIIKPRPPMNPTNSKWLRISPTLGLTNTFFQRFLDHHDLRGTRPVLRVVNYTNGLLKLYDGTLACDCQFSAELKNRWGLAKFFPPGIRVMLTDFRQVYNLKTQIGRVQPILIINNLRRLDIDMGNSSNIRATQQLKRQMNGGIGVDVSVVGPSTSSSNSNKTTGGGMFFDRAQNIVPCMPLPFGHLPSRLRPTCPPLKYISSLSSAELEMGGIKRKATDQGTTASTSNFGVSPVKFYRLDSPPKLLPNILQQQGKKIATVAPVPGEKSAPKVAAASITPTVTVITLNSSPIKLEEGGCPKLVKEEFNNNNDGKEEREEEICE